MLLQLVLISLYAIASGQQAATDATFAGVYAGAQPDSCGYGIIAPSVSPHLATLRKNSAILAGLPQGSCGACIQVTCTDPAPGVCPAGSVPLIVQIVDESSTGLQLSAADMAAVSPQGNRLGHVGVSIQQVNCPASGSILVRLQQLSPTANGYAKLALLNVAGSGGVTAVGFAPAGSQTFTPLKNNYGAVWEGSIPAAPPLDMQIMSRGQTLILSDLITASTTPGDIPSTFQFTGTGSLGAVGIPSPAGALSPAATGANATSPGASPVPSPDNSSAASPTSSPPSSPAALPVSPPASPNASSMASPEASPSPSPTASPVAVGASAPLPAPGSQEPLPATPANGTLFNLAAAVMGIGCSTIIETLSLSPDLTTWVSLIESKGLQFNLNGSSQGITMFAPINNAFSEPLLAGISGLDGANTVSDLTGSIPDIVSDLLGYSVVPQRLLENQLMNGDMFNTTNVIKTGNGVNGVPAFIPIDITSDGDMTKVRGTGSVATLLQPNIEACGSVIHIISNALLPFNVRTLNLPTVTPTSPVTENLPATASPIATAMSG